MIEEEIVLQKKGRFRIQELSNDFKEIQAESFFHNSVNLRSRFTVTTKEVPTNSYYPQLLILVMETEKQKWVLLKEKDTSKGDGSFCLEKGKMRSFRYDSHSFTKNKTNDESEDKGSFNKNDSKYLDFIAKIKENWTKIQAIQKLLKAALLIQNRDNQIIKENSLEFEFLSNKEYKPHRPDRFSVTSLSSFSIEIK